MPDSQQQGQQPPASEPTSEDVQAAFWKEHETRTRGILDAWFADKLKEYQGTRTSRTGGRPSLGGFIADIMFGPEPKK